MTMGNAIIDVTEVMSALVAGFEVLHIKPSVTNRYGVYCRPLTQEVFKNIDELLEMADDEDIFVKVAAEEPPREDEKPEESPEDDEQQ